MGVWVAVGAVVVGVAFGLYRKVTDGRFRTRATTSPDTTPDAPRAAMMAEVSSEASAVAVPGTWHGLELGERATLVQFSSAFCAPCRTTRVILGDVATTEPGVVHHDVDAEAELALVRELNILRTPTTIILDGTGREIARASGAPRKDQVLAALAEL
ncbi:thioredoxin family protein [Nocardioides sp.]|jgi:thiol-disulfide isomerase/thioredoxin|uniref:thioredoxin family protein n=1 Tax=Nocardioides sp. TaxID=35761 RepID=UPI0026321913|nr:thioredoxin family protein [Nocardioides sp.]